MLLYGCGGSNNPEPESLTDNFIILDKAHQFIDFNTGENNRDLSFDYNLPQDVSIYHHIDLKIKLDCPSGGCDPWDRLALISLVHEQNTFEIARYITPYGIGCEYVTDITEYRDLLAGDNVNFISHIDTWVNTGWLVTLELEYLKSVSTYDRFEVQNIWNDSHLVYGDPLQSVKQPETMFELSDDPIRVVVKATITGHGQGNTQNAAEFLPRVHKLWINDQAFPHQIWRTDCGDNPGCSNQKGNWTSPRAGWCPGKVFLYENNGLVLTEAQTLGRTIRIEYELEDFINECRPDNANCDATICTDCNYNDTGHTEPFYNINIQLIQYL